MTKNFKMTIDEFIKYINSMNIQWDSEEIEKLNYFINAVNEIEEYNLELNMKSEYHYLKKFMFPKDYILILKDLRNVREAKFYKILQEKKKYLKKLELSQEEYNKIYEDFEKKLAKQLNIKIYYSPRKNKTIIK